MERKLFDTYVVGVSWSIEFDHRFSERRVQITDANFVVLKRVFRERTRHKSSLILSVSQCHQNSQSQQENCLCHCWCPWKKNKISDFNMKIVIFKAVSKLCRWMNFVLAASYWEMFSLLTQFAKWLKAVQQKCFYLILNVIILFEWDQVSYKIQMWIKVSVVKQSVHANTPSPWFQLL